MLNYHFDYIYQQLFMNRIWLLILCLYQLIWITDDINEIMIYIIEKQPILFLFQWYKWRKRKSYYMVVLNVTMDCMCSFQANKTRNIVVSLLLKFFQDEERWNASLEKTNSAAARPCDRHFRQKLASTAVCSWKTRISNLNVLINWMFHQY